MPRNRALFFPLVITLLAAAFAGCLGGDELDGPVDEDDGTARPSDSTGSVQGRVLTETLDPIRNSRVVLAKDNRIEAEGATDAQGRYVINDVAPGDYRMQVSATCCREELQMVRVEAAKITTVDVQLRAFTAADLRAPRVEPNEWNGFLACGFGVIVLAGSPCGELDPNDEFMLEWDLPEGVQEIAFAMEWQAVGGIVGEQLQIVVENLGCNITECSHRYADVSGTSPLIFTVASPGGEWAFENVKGSRAMQFRVFPDFEPGVFWQQPFTVHYHLFFNQDVPPGYNPIPDN